MIIDKQLQLGSAQAVTVTAPSTNYVDAGAAGEPGLDDRGQQLMITVDTTFTAAGAATMKVQLQTDSDPAFGTVKTIVETDVIPLAGLVAGQAPIYMKLPIGLNKRYFRMNYVVATGPMTAGAISCQLVDAPQSNTAYKAPSQL